MRQDIFHQSPLVPADGISYPPLFNEIDAISGGFSEITPEFAMQLGHAAAAIASRICIGYSECSICKLLASAFTAGAGSAGAKVTETDSSFFAVAAYIARTYLFNMTVFFENDNGRLRIRIIDKFGLPIDRETRRKTEYFLNSAKSIRAGISDISMPKIITGAKEAFALSCARRGALDGFKLSVEGKSLAAETLKYVLTVSGGEIVAPRAGVISLSSSDDGTKLYIRDENENWYDGGHTDALLALIYFLCGNREIAVEATAPSALEQIAADFDSRILRIGRDNAAREIFLNQSVLTDAASSAILLCSYLFAENETVRTLIRKLPDFTMISREISLNTDRQQIITHLAESGDGLHKENTGELRRCADGGWVSISPSRSRCALRITGEGMSEEIASELCDLFIEKARTIDQTSKK